MNTQKTSWFEKNPKKTIAFVLVAIFILFSMLDFSLYKLFARGCIWTYSPYYHHGKIKNFTQKEDWADGKKEIKYIDHTNSLGFKDSKIRKVALKSNKYRILFIGDSFTEGVGYPYDLTFVGLFEKMLDKDRFEVLNAAAISYSPKLYYLKIKYLIENVGLKFDELFVFIDISDIYDELDYKEFSPITNTFHLFFTKSHILLAQKSYTFNKISLLWYNAKYRITEKFLLFIEKIKHNKNNSTKTEAETPPARSSWIVDKKEFDSWGREGLSLADKHMELLFELCKKHNIKMNIAVYPWPEQIANKDLNSIQVKHWEDFAKKRHIGFIDYFPYFINNADPKSVITDKFIPDDVHWSEKGHRLIADILYKYWNGRRI